MLFLMSLKKIEIIGNFPTTLVTGITKEKLLLMLQAVYLQAMVQHLECSMK